MNKIRKVIYSLITLSLVFSSLNLNVLAFEDPDATDDKVTVNINIGENSEGLSVESATIQVQRGDIPSESDYGIKYQAYWKLSGFKVNSGTNLRKDFNTVQFLDDVNTITFYGFPDRNGNDKDDRVENLLDELNPVTHERLTVNLNGGAYSCNLENVQNGQTWKVIYNYDDLPSVEVEEGKIPREATLNLNIMQDPHARVNRISCQSGNDTVPSVVNVYYDVDIALVNFQMRQGDEGNLIINGAVATIVGHPLQTTRVELTLPEHWVLDGYYVNDVKTELNDIITTNLDVDKNVEVRTFPDVDKDGLDDRKKPIPMPLPNDNTKEIKFIYTTGEDGQNVENSCSMSYNRNEVMNYEVIASYVYYGKTYTSSFYDAILGAEKNGVVDLNSQSLFKGYIPSINPKNMNCYIRENTLVIDLNFNIDEKGKPIETHIMKIDMRRGDKGTFVYSYLPYYQESENLEKYFLVSRDLFFGENIVYVTSDFPGWKKDGFYVNGVKKELKEIIKIASTQNVEVEFRTFPDSLNDNGIDDRLEQEIFHTVTYRNVRGEIIHEVRVKHGENAPAFGYNEEVNYRPYGKTFCYWSAEPINVVEDMNLRPSFCPQKFKIEAYHGDVKTDDNTLDLNLEKEGKAVTILYGEKILIKDANGNVYSEIQTYDKHIGVIEGPKNKRLITKTNAEGVFEVRLPEARFSGWRYFDGWKIEKVTNDIVLSPIVREKITNPIVQPQPQPQPKPEIKTTPKEETTTPNNNEEIKNNVSKPKTQKSSITKKEEKTKEIEKKQEEKGETITIEVPKNNNGSPEIQGLDKIDVEIGKEISFKDESGNVIETIKVDKNTKLKLPKAPKVEGKLFKGWKAEKDNQGNIIIIAYYEDVKTDEVKSTETKSVEKEDVKSSFPIILGLSGLGLTGLLILFVVFLKKKNKEDELKFQNKFENKDIDVNNSDFFDME